MLRTSLCPQQQPPAGPQRSPGDVPGAAALLLLLLLASCTGACRGVPVPSQTFQAEQDLQLWNEIAEACSSYLSTDPQVPSALEELCFIVMGFLQKPQGLDEKDNTKRSSVLHPLLQLVPQLSERRLKRDKMDEEYQGPGAIQSRGYFIFRPRNGRRSAGFR
ncbi:neuromedin-U isoform X4 [Alligator mississippiensis]|uniref:neuromedin-U isoform X4 n=1 Tax=Alligator mississippiensis TaxID=8496 RepID=UPI002877801A|nr:neuromedin-U isoform X4 [Alligator mississippiensis]